MSRLLKLLKFLPGFFVLLLAAAIPLFSLGCYGSRAQSGYGMRQDGRAQRPQHAYNVLLVCLDTLRADHVGCYGYFRDTTPHIDALAKGGILFEEAFAQSTFTLPSIASVFVSKYVHSHTVDRIERRLPEKEITLAEILRKHGYKTAAFSYNAAQLDPSFGLKQGFDTYLFGTEKNREPSFEKTVPQALTWLARHKHDRFFVFLHGNDIHEPYHCPLDDFFDKAYRGRLDREYLAPENPRFHENNLTRTPREVAHIVAHYDGGIRYADGFIGQLVRGLTELGLLEKTIVIFFSDHGEILADRGMRFCHGFSVHDEEIHVPLIIIHPALARRGVRLKGLVQLIDVMPTVLDFLSIETRPQAMEGKSLWPMIEGREESPHRYVHAECFSGESEREGISIRHTAVRGPSWKLIRSVCRVTKKHEASLPRSVKMHNGAIISLPWQDGYELYNLRLDSAESRNLLGQGFEDIVKEFLQEMAVFG